MNPILKSVAEERLRIKQERAALDEAEAKLNQIETLATQLYSTQGEAVQAAIASLTSPFGAPKTEPPLTKRERIYQAVEVILSDGKRRTSGELVPLLRHHGVPVEGKDEANNLGAYLSSSGGRFTNDRKAGGWMSKLAPKKASPHDVSASGGLFGSTNGAGQRPLTAG